MRSIARLVAAGALVVGTPACSGDQDVANTGAGAWYGDFVVGDYPVGFRSETITRPGPEGRRELVLSVWYPAVADVEVDAVQLRHYFRGTLREGQLSETVGLDEASAFAAAMTGSPAALSAERARAGLDARTMARLDAPPANGSYPLALFSSRHATLLAQSPLAEVLASHGFVTATVWSSNPPLAFLWEDHPTEDKLATVEAHTGDLERALEQLRRDPSVEPDNVVVLAWSYGGQTAARLQEREPGVRGIIALDANVVPARPEESLELRRPLVYLVGRDTSGRGFDRLRRITAPWTAVRFTGLAHGSFNALESYLPAVLGADTVYAWSQAGPVARDGYKALVRVATVAAKALTSGEGEPVTQLAPTLREAAGDVPVEVLTSTEGQR